LALETRIAPVGDGAMLRDPALVRGQGVIAEPWIETRYLGVGGIER
jgi:hypothetical protein